MKKTNTPAQELAAIREEIERARQGHFPAWQYASHIIGRYLVSRLSDHGLMVVFEQEYRELQEKAGIRG